MEPHVVQQRCRIALGILPLTPLARVQCLVRWTRNTLAVRQCNIRLQLMAGLHRGCPARRDGAELFLGDMRRRWKCLGSERRSLRAGRCGPTLAEHRSQSNWPCVGPGGQRHHLFECGNLAHPTSFMGHLPFGQSPAEHAVDRRDALRCRGM